MKDLRTSVDSTFRLRRRSGVLAIAAASAVIVMAAASTAAAATTTLVSGTAPTTVEYVGPGAPLAERPALVISSLNTSWGGIAGAQWINHRGLPNGAPGKYVYRTSIVLPAGAVNGNVVVSWLSDNIATATLNGVVSDGAASFRVNTLQSMTREVTAGTNPIRFDVTNDAQVGNPTGLIYKAVVTWDMDSDGDGRTDANDNCPEAANPGQEDLAGDGSGDVCDLDDDNDGVADDVDNAPRHPNPDQQDLDGDGLGDVADPTVLPIAADQCKRNGWKRFFDQDTRFKNQGDCVSFVATVGRNLPAGA
jgi:hypothetical protein